MTGDPRRFDLSTQPFDGDLLTAKYVHSAFSAHFCAHSATSVMGVAPPALLNLATAACAAFSDASDSARRLVKSDSATSSMLMMVSAMSVLAPPSSGASFTWAKEPPL